MAINWESNKYYKSQNSPKNEKSFWGRFLAWVKAFLS
jgi:hypothetical protein